MRRIAPSILRSLFIVVAVATASSSSRIATSNSASALLRVRWIFAARFFSAAHGFGAAAIARA